MNDRLQIEDLLLGDGKEVVKGALITTQYKGTLEDGTLFDSSYERGRPFQCVIGTGRVIKGWDQGLMGMKVGGKRRLFVPSHLAYGERQGGAHIKPHLSLRRQRQMCIRDSCWKCSPATTEPRDGGGLWPPVPNQCAGRIVARLPALHEAGFSSNPRGEPRNPWQWREAGRPAHAAGRTPGRPPPRPRPASGRSRPTSRNG